MAGSDLVSTPDALTAGSLARLFQLYRSGRGTAASGTAQAGHDRQFRGSKHRDIVRHREKRLAPSFSSNTAVRDNEVIFRDAYYRQPRSHLVTRLRSPIVPGNIRCSFRKLRLRGRRTSPRPSMDQRISAPFSARFYATGVLRRHLRRKSRDAVADDATVQQGRQSGKLNVSAQLRHDAGPSDPYLLLGLTRCRTARHVRGKRP